MKCKECDGTGFISIGNGIGCHNCDACNGTGKEPEEPKFTIDMLDIALDAAATHSGKDKKKDD